MEPVTERLTASPHSSAPTLSGSPFPRIAEYRFLSDCEVSALIAATPASEKRRAGTLAQGARRQAKRDSRLA